MNWTERKLGLRLCRYREDDYEEMTVKEYDERELSKMLKQMMIQIVCVMLAFCFRDSLHFLKLHCSNCFLYIAHF